MRNGSTPNPLGLSTIVVAKKVVEKKKNILGNGFAFPGEMASASLWTTMNFTNLLQNIPSGVR